MHSEISKFAKEIPIPTDDEVLYGKIGMLGHLVHRNELDLNNGEGG